MVPPVPGAPDSGCRAPGLVAAGLRAVLLNPPPASGALCGVSPPDGRALRGDAAGARAAAERCSCPSLCSLARLAGASACAQGEAARGRPGMRGAAPARLPAGVGPRRRCRPPPRMPFLRRSRAEQPAGAGDPQLSATGRSAPSTFGWHPDSVTLGCPGTPGRHRRG